MATGSIVIVGTGITLGSHISPLSRSYIENADVVFAGVADGITELWLKEMHQDVRSFAPLYEEGKSRHETYQQMIDLMLAEVRLGKKVVCAFYGHPGVFAYAPHKVIELARAEGYAAHMEPGISSADCLHAELGIDPGKVGCQYFETSQYMFYQRNIDPTAYLVLWQVGIAGDKSMARFGTGAAYRQVLVELLAEHYPLSHQVILYEAASLPFQQARISKLPLSALPQAEMNLKTTLVLPPATSLKKNQAVLDKLAAIRAAEQLQTTADIAEAATAELPESEYRPDDMSCQQS
ncbi:SAM-dependent methyltransferase [Rheinheimera sp.]|uniref:SAM-dependent methyltransferase n=1 Tax=Rheinheimera sp. TaxID=1869214 RepID=UPI0027BA1885|nr:SAM-dependent methyltransferase [Rheinheimera sp.]